MSNLNKQVKKKSKQTDELITCHRCDARYSKNARWMLVSYDEGTSGNYRKNGDVGEGHCPICRKPPLLEKPVIYGQRGM